MIGSSKSEHASVLPTAVWEYLPSEHRAKAGAPWAQFMAQLAFNLLKAQVDLANEEATDVNRPNAQQNSS